MVSLLEDNLKIGLRHSAEAAALHAPQQFDRAYTKRSDNHFRLQRDDGHAFFETKLPAVFAEVRKVFGVSTVEYVDSICGDAGLIQLGAQELGKSGAAFFKTRDGRFIIKTIEKEEFDFLLELLIDYLAHVRSMARALLETLLPRFFDLIHVATDAPGSDKVRCIVMNNLKPVAELTGVRIHQTYDLKGSWVNRFRGSADEGATLKDEDYTARLGALDVSREHHDTLRAQLERDTAWLEKHDIMDYSLLCMVGDGTRTGLRGSSLACVASRHTSHFSPSPSAAPLPRAPARRDGFSVC
jgi:1-phosphatidylinositol-4-phosphate 5-kinase